MTIWPRVAMSAVLSLSTTASVLAAQSGQSVFDAKCVVCHSPGTERVVGPGLAGVMERRDATWVKRQIMEPDRLLAENDPLATELLAEYQIAMPNLLIPESEADALLEYLRTLTAGDAASGPAPATPTIPPPVQAFSPDQIALGESLFQGTVRLTNGGPTCNACHDVTNDAVIGGGVLARDLTSVFSRLGGPGVRAILGSPPFPVMQRAYEGKALTDDEVQALVGFLQHADEEQSLHQPRDYGRNLFIAGVLGVAFLFVLYSLIWKGRLRGSVYQSIYDRQLSST